MNNVLISNSAPQTASVESISRPDTAADSNTQASPPFAKVLARKVDKPAESKSSADADSSIANATSAPQEQAAVTADALSIILAQIPVEMRGTNISDRLSQLAPGPRTTALDPAALRMDTPLVTGLPASPPSTTQSDVAFHGELSSTLPPAQLVSVDKNATIDAGTPLAERQLLADALRQRMANHQDISANPALLASTQATVATTIPQATVAAMTGSSAANQPTPASQTIATPLTSPAWGEDFSQKINWMVSQKNQVAELHLNPPNLGPLDVVIKISDAQATALFASPHAAVREAVENALPKLRELLADNGIMLSNATVGDQSPRDRGQEEMSGQKASAFPGNNAAEETREAPGTILSVSRHNGMVDTFA